MRRVLINVEDRELRVAILEDEQLLELYIESLEDKSILNNIYKGRIEGILPGLKAAFVNVGLERNAFLHFDDVRPDLLWARYRQDHPEVEVPALPSPAEDAELEAAEPAAIPDLQEVPFSEVAGEDAATEAREIQEEAADAEEESGRRRRRRGRRGGKRRKRDADQPFDPVRDEVLDADIDSGDDEDDEEEELLPQQVAPPRAEAETGEHPEADDQDDREVAETPGEGEAASSSESVQQQQRNARSERQRRRRERWEQKKLERKLRRQQEGGGPPAGQGQGAAQRPQQQRQIQPHPTTTAAANSWVPPAMRGAPGTRGAANPYDVFSPYNQPPAAKRQWGKRGGGADDWGNQRTAPRRNDHRDSQEDFFGPAPRMRPPQLEDDERQPFRAAAGANEYYDDEYNEGPAPGNEKFPSAQPGGQNRNQPGARRNKRRGGRNRVMKKRNPSYYAARAKKGTEPAAPDASAEQEKPKTRRGKPAPAKPAAETPGPEVRKPSRSRKKEAEAPEIAAVPSSAPEAPKKRTRKRAEEIPSTAPAPADAAPETEVRAPRSRKKKADVAGEDPTNAKPELSAAQVEPATEAPVKKASRARGKKVTPRDSKETAASETTPQDQPESAGEDKQSAESPIVQAAEVAAAVLESDAATGPTVSAEPPGGETREGRERPQRRGRRGRGRDRGERPQAEQTSDQARTQDVAPTGESEERPQEQPQTSREERRQERDRGRDRKRERDKDREAKPRRWQRPPLFTETFKKGDEIIVQVIKEEIGMKGARISTYVSMPGRYLVLLPYPNEEGGISRKVEDVAERKRLKRLLKDISSEDMAFIIRTAGIYRDEADIRSDVEFLTQEWRQIAERAKTTEVGNVIYDDHDILYRLARDVFDDNIGEILIDSHVEADKLKSILQKLIPGLVDKVKVYSGADNIFHKYGVEKQIQKAARRKVWLKSGGYLIIDEAEALTAIDVNTGKSVGKDDQEKLILKTNLEAARAVARELKLRDIGGLIVIDFIDMKDTRNRDQVVNELKTALRKDRSKTSVSTISEFGLVEMTRKRVRRSLRKTLFMDCPYCQGAGVVLNEQQIWLHLKHEIVRQLEASRPAPSLSITVNSKIRGYIDQNYRDTVRKLEQKYDTEIRFTMSDVFHVENYAIEKVGAATAGASMSAASGGK